MKMTFVKSATQLRDCPEDKTSEWVLLGRSNAGKSSLVNALSGQRKLAKVSSQPGKTRLINFFDVDSKFRVVDLPGYGYAARSKEERDEWRTMVEAFLSTRSNIVGALLIMDVRRDWSIDETHLVQWCSSFGLKVSLIVTKVDKLSRSQLMKRVQEIRNQLQKPLGADASEKIQCLPVSSVKREGFDELESFLFKNTKFKR